MSGLFSLDIYYLLYFFVAIFAASFAVPTGALIIIVSFASTALGLADILLLIFLTLSATISGDYSAFWVARYFKVRLDPYIARHAWLQAKAMTIDRLLKKYGAYTVFLTRFMLSGVGPYVNLFSGLRALPQWTFLRAVILGELVYTLLFIAIGYFFRETWQAVILVVKDYTIFTVLAVISGFVLYRVIRLLKHNNERKS